jgi:sulfide:quinone oxidoreductase
MVLRWYFKRAGVSKDVDIHVYTPEEAPLPVAGQAACEMLALAMASRNISFHPKAGVKEISGDRRSAAFTDGSSMDADVIITIPAHRPASVAVEAGLTAGKPWVPVNAATLETSTQGVFAIGDVNMVPMATGKPVPKAGVFASSEGETVARLIASRIMGTAPPPPFPGEGKCFLAYSGTQSGAVAGRFLAPGKPEVSFTRPSVSGMRDKERFESDWRRFRT